MRATRIFWFVVSIAVGIAGGLLVGWMVIPAGPKGDTTPATLRADYRTDLVLMTAEIYRQEGDPVAAAARLAEFDSSQSPLRVVQQAILSGQELGYARADLETMGDLFQALVDWKPPAGTGQP